MMQRKIWLAFLFILTVGVAVSARIVYLGDSVQAVNHQFIAEKLPLSQHLGELRGAIADEERLLYEYYSYTATREVFLQQRRSNKSRIGEIVAQLEQDIRSRAELVELREQLSRLDALSDVLSATLGESEIDWDRARVILALVKPQVREIEARLVVIATANQQAVNMLGKDSQSSVSSMVSSVIGFSVLIFGVAFFVGYYVVSIIREGVERRRLALFAERDPNPVLRLNAVGMVLYTNPASGKMLAQLGLSANHWAEMLPQDLLRHLAETRETLGLSTQFEYAHGVFTLECTIAYLDDFAEFHVYLKDVSSRKQAEERLAYQAFFDAATGLPNQYQLRDELNQALMERSGGSVMMIVADREQEILESFGEVETEKWLVKIAQRLRESLEAEAEKLYRFGSNAFVLVRQNGDIEDARQRAERLLEIARMPLAVDGHELFSTLSIGAALMDSGLSSGNKTEALIQQSASACNRTRRAGGNDFALFDEAMSLSASKALHLAADLRHAVEKGELRLQYQPKVEASSGRLTGMEALVRWMHPERGMISPVEFIPVAEDTGLIIEIGRWVLREACRQNVEWQRAGLRPLRVAVNLSARQFRSGTLLQEIDAAIRDSGIPVETLELEVTESMVMDDPESVIQLLGEIHQRGIHLALDDFGTGHSSLAYLKRFPIDCVKIDRAFVKDTPDNADDVAIARTIVAMAQALGLETVAEGVETVDQLELLKSMGCGLIQGYYYSRPLPADQFLGYYRENE